MSTPLTPLPSAPVKNDNKLRISPTHLDNPASASTHRSTEIKRHSSTTMDHTDSGLLAEQAFSAAMAAALTSQREQFRRDTQNLTQRGSNTTTAALTSTSSNTTADSSSSTSTEGVGVKSTTTATNRPSTSLFQPSRVSDSFPFRRANRNNSEVSALIAKRGLMSQSLATVVAEWKKSHPKDTISSSNDDYDHVSDDTSLNKARKSTASRRNNASHASSTSVDVDNRTMITASRNAFTDIWLMDEDTNLPTTPPLETTPQSSTTAEELKHSRDEMMTYTSDSLELEMARTPSPIMPSPTTSQYLSPALSAMISSNGGSAAVAANITAGGGRVYDHALALPRLYTSRHTVDANGDSFETELSNDAASVISGGSNSQESWQSGSILLSATSTSIPSSSSHHRPQSLPTMKSRMSSSSSSSSSSQTAVMPSHFRTFDISMPSHNLLSMGSYNVSAEHMSDFVVAYVNDIAADALRDFRPPGDAADYTAMANRPLLNANYVATPQRHSSSSVGQHSISEIGYKESFPLFFDLDHLLGGIPNAADQCVYGIQVRAIQNAVHLCFPNKNDEDWYYYGTVFVTQTLARPLAEEVIKEFMPNTTASPVSVAPANANGLNMQPQDTETQQKTHHAIASIIADTMSNGHSSKSTSFGATMPWSPREELTASNSSHSAATTIVGDMSFLQDELSLGCSTSLFPPSAENSLMEAPPSTTTHQNNLLSEASSSSLPVVSAAAQPPQSSESARIQGIHKHETILDPLELMNKPLEQWVPHKLGMHIIFPHLFVKSEQASEIREVVIRILVDYVWQARWLFENTKIMIKTNGKHTTAKDATVDQQVDMCRQIIDDKVWGETPHKRMFRSYKINRQCYACGGRYVPTSKQKKSEVNATTVKSGKLTDKNVESTTATTLQKPNPACIICNGTGMTSEGPASVSDLVYALNGDGSLFKPEHMERLLEQHDTARLNVADYAYLSYDQWMRIGKDRACLEALRPFVQTRYQPAVYDMINLKLAERPIQFAMPPSQHHHGSNNMQQRVLSIKSVPRPLTRFMKWSTIKGLKLYLTTVMWYTMIRNPKIDKSFAYTSSMWAETRTPGMILPCNTSLGARLSSLNHQISIGHGAMTAALKRQLNAATDTAIGVAPSATVDEDVMKPYNTYHVLIHEPLERRLCQFLRSLKPGLTNRVDHPVPSMSGSIGSGDLVGGRRRANTSPVDPYNEALAKQMDDTYGRCWRYLTFELPRWVKSVPKLTPRFQHHTPDELEALAYEGPCILVFATGIGSNFCSIQMRAHRSTTILFRITPTHVIQLDHSSSANINPQTSAGFACRYAYGHCLWRMDLSLSTALFSLKLLPSNPTTAQPNNAANNGGTRRRVNHGESTPFSGGMDGSIIGPPPAKRRNSNKLTTTAVATMNDGTPLDDVPMNFQEAHRVFQPHGVNVEDLNAAFARYRASSSSTSSSNKPTTVFPFQ